MPDPTAQPPVPFDEVTDDAYAVAFLHGVDAVENRRGVELRGRCPRCGDPMDFPVVTEVFRSTVAPGGAAAGVTDETTVLCTCQEIHPARPAGETGCGAYWNIRLTPRRN
jgi:hypothetical protein